MKQATSELKQLVKVQLAFICTSIIIGTTAYGFYTFKWLLAVKVGSAFICAAVLGAPLIYSKAKTRMQNIQLLKTKGE